MQDLPEEPTPVDSATHSCVVSFIWADVVRDLYVREPAEAVSAEVDDDLDEEASEFLEDVET